MFSGKPGVAITHRNELNVFNTEEIDVAIWNDGAPDGFFFLPNIVLIECKNWSNRVGSAELNWFDNCGIVPNIWNSHHDARHYGTSRRYYRSAFCCLSSASRRTAAHCYNCR
jgi:hypothetical protein